MDGAGKRTWTYSQRVLTGPAPPGRPRHSGNNAGDHPSGPQHYPPGSTLVIHFYRNRSGWSAAV